MNIIIQKTLLIFILCSLMVRAYSQQLSIGPIFNFGEGMIFSGNLKKSFVARKAIDEDIVQWESKNKLGFNFGIGGFAEYLLDENTALIGELTYNISKSKIAIEHIGYDVDINGNGGGDEETIESEATIKMSYFQLPVIVKHYFLRKAGPYAIYGAGLNFASMPEIESSETKTSMTYENFKLIETTVDVSKASADMDVFNPIMVSFILGAGTVFDLYGRNLAVDLRLNLSLNKSTIYTTNGFYDELTYKNNEVFGIRGKIEAEADAPGYRLEDYRMSTITISIRYSLFNKSINKSNIQKDEQNTP